jgi:hypothetical protein
MLQRDSGRIASSPHDRSQPAPDGKRRRMDVWHSAYPTTEYGGLVFVYMGPPGTESLFPIYDIIDTRHLDDVVMRGMRLWGDYSVGFVKDCNWLQTTRTLSIRGTCWCCTR